ncbi:MAG TPA: SDR family oxidoreductase [Dehalococcoidia bacterium]|nr:SDR family oxidoreductase [Dehalococcoidia bacterium]
MTTPDSATRLLDGKNAIIYGASGFIGRGVARAFARAGATLFLVGRTESSLQAVADEIAANGGRAYVGVVDALEERAVEQHARSVVEKVGGIDVSFNLTTRGDVQGTPLLDMDVEDFLRPIATGMRSNFITARAAAQHMVARGSGVILMLNSGSGGPQVATPPDVWPMGGTGPADAAMDTFIRYLAAEVGPRGIRVVGLWTAGVADPTRRGPGDEPDPLETMKDEIISPRAMLRRRATVPEVADAAAFLASDRASAITACIVSVSSGLSVH